MISSKKKKSTGKSVAFPKLMLNRKNDYIVFFYEDCKGVVVHGCNDMPEGFFSEHWGMYNFTDYDGSVTLENVS